MLFLFVPLLTVFSCILPISSYAEELPTKLISIQDSQLSFEAPALSDLIIEANAGEYKQKYHLKWQLRLLAIQQSFASSLVGVDMVETGSITHQE